MALNKTILMRWLGEQLGISHTYLEVSDDYLFQIIQDDTMKTFSKYFPALFRVTLRPAEMAMTGRTGMYIIPTSVIPSDDLIGINKILPSTYLPSKDGYLMAFTSDIFDRQLMADGLSMLALPNTFKFYPPNIVELFPKNFYYNSIFFEFRVRHHKNFFTIPNGLEEEFRKLALIDCKAAIYNIRVNYPEVTTAFGNITLITENFQNAKEERQTLLDKWEENYWKSPYRKRIFRG